MQQVIAASELHLAHPFAPLAPISMELRGGGGEDIKADQKDGAAQLLQILFQRQYTQMSTIMHAYEWKASRAHLESGEILK